MTLQTRIQSLEERVEQLEKQGPSLTACTVSTTTKSTKSEASSMKLNSAAALCDYYADQLGKAHDSGLINRRQMLMLMAVVAAGTEALGKKVGAALQAGEKTILMECLSDPSTCFSACLRPRMYDPVTSSIHPYLNFIPYTLHQRARGELGQKPRPPQVYNWCLDNDVLAKPVLANFVNCSPDGVDIISSDSNRVSWHDISSFYNKK
eukprot:Lankesteria_metandrocarpae@DN5470_c1_g1_i5.p1